MIIIVIGLLLLFACTLVLVVAMDLSRPVDLNDVWVDEEVVGSEDGMANS